MDFLNISIFDEVEILNGHYGRIFSPIQMSFGTFVHTEHINMCVQGNLDRCHILGIRVPQSWEKSRNFTFFAIFVIFDQFRTMVLWATFLNFFIKPILVHNLDTYQ